MRRRASSWAGGDVPKSSPHNGAEAEFVELQQARALDTNTSPTETLHLTLDGRKKDAGKQELSLNIPDDKASKASIATLEDPKLNGDEKEKKTRQHSSTKSKEAKLKRLHWRNLTTRATVAEKRRELGEARLQVNRADEGLMKIVREMRIQQSGGNCEGILVLEEHYSRLQDARDIYGTLEEYYNSLEEQLDREEYEVIQLEEKLADDDSALQSPFDDSDASSFDSSESESDGFAVVENDENALYDEYMSRQGDANMVREDIAELRFTYKKLQEVRASWQKVGRELSREDQAIWDNFLTKEAALYEKLQGIEAEVKRLRTECAQAGLLGEGEESEAQNEDVDILNNSKESLMSEYERFPLLLEQPNEEKVDEKTVSLISEFDPRDRGDRIARWLLHKLRSSCGEVELLARISASDHGLEPFTTTGKWQEEVLDFWFLDSTILSPSAYQVQATVNKFDIPTSPFADKNNVSLFQSGQAQLIQLVIRSSSVISKMEFALLLSLTIPRGEDAKSV
jgi:hypothetical protein